MTYLLLSVRHTGTFFTLMQSTDGKTAAKLACVGSTKCGLLRYHDTNTGFTPFGSLITSVWDTTVVSARYQRLLTGLAIGSRAQSTLSDSVHIRIQHRAPLTCTALAEGGMAYTVSCLQRLGARRSSMFTTHSHVLPKCTSTTINNTEISLRIWPSAADIS